MDFPDNIVCYILAQSSISTSQKKEWGSERKGRVIFGALGLVTDVRLCNEMCNTVICQKGAVMSFSKVENTSIQMDLE